MKVVGLDTDKNEIMYGVGSVIHSCQLPFVLWNPNTKAALDMLDELKPDILLLPGNYQPTEDLLYALGEYKNIQVAHLTSGPTNISNAVSIEIKPAANLVKFAGGTYSETYQSNIFYLSDLYPIPKILLDSIKYKPRFVGPVRLPFLEYVGDVDLYTLHDMLASTKICLDISMRHAYDYIGTGRFCLSSVENPICPMFTDDNVDLYLNDEDKRKQYVADVRSKILANDTYHHRTAEIFHTMGYETYAQNLLQHLKLFIR